MDKTSYGKDARSWAHDGLRHPRKRRVDAPHCCRKQVFRDGEIEMTDHANELRRYSRKIGHPAGDVPSVMLAAAEEIERLAARLEAAEKSDAESLTMYRKARDERDALRAKIEAKENALGDWLYANAPGGWIDNLRVKCDAMGAELKAAHAMALNGVEWRELAQKYEAETEAMEKQEPFTPMPSLALLNRALVGSGTESTAT